MCYKWTILWSVWSLCTCFDAAEVFAIKIQPNNVWMQSNTKLSLGAPWQLNLKLLITSHHKGRMHELGLVPLLKSRILSDPISCLFSSRSCCHWRTWTMDTRVWTSSKIVLFKERKDLPCCKFRPVIMWAVANIWKCLHKYVVTVLSNLSEVFCYLHQSSYTCHELQIQAQSMSMVYVDAKVLKCNPVSNSDY